MGICRAHSPGDTKLQLHEVCPDSLARRALRSRGGAGQGVYALAPHVSRHGPADLGRRPGFAETTDQEYPEKGDVSPAGGGCVRTLVAASA